MSDTIIVALIALVGTVLSGVISARIARDKTLALVEYRIQQLEKRIDKTNSLIERVYQLESDITTMQHDIALLQRGEG